MVEACNVVEEEFSNLRIVVILVRVPGLVDINDLEHYGHKSQRWLFPTSKSGESGNGMSARADY